MEASRSRYLPHLLCTRAIFLGTPFEVCQLKWVLSQIPSCAIFEYVCGVAGRLWSARYFLWAKTLKYIIAAKISSVTGHFICVHFLVSCSLSFPLVASSLSLSLSLIVVVFSSIYIPLAVFRGLLAQAYSLILFFFFLVNILQ